MPVQTFQAEGLSHIWNPQLAGAWLDHAGSEAERDALATQSLAAQRAGVQALWTHIGQAFAAANLNPTASPTFLTALRDALRSMVYTGYSDEATAHGVRPVSTPDWRSAPRANAPVALWQASFHGIGAEVAELRLGSDPDAWPLGYDPFFASVLQAPDPQASGSNLWALTPALRLRADGAVTSDAVQTLATNYPNGTSHAWDRGRILEAPTTGWAWFGLAMNAGGAAPTRGIVVIPPLRAWYDAGLAVIARLRAVGWQILLGESVAWTVRRNLWTAHLWGVDPSADTTAQINAATSQASARLQEAERARDLAQTGFSGVVTASTFIPGVGLFVRAGLALLALALTAARQQWGRLTLQSCYDFWGYQQPSQVFSVGVDPLRWMPPPAPPGWADAALIGAALALPDSTFTTPEEVTPAAPETTLVTRRGRALLILGALTAAGYGIVRWSRARRSASPGTRAAVRSSARR